MKVIVSGGRNYTASRKDWMLLKPFSSIDELIVGDASGADDFAREWGYIAGVKVKVFRADWEAHGLSAGPIRNTAMLDYAGDDVIVILFPGGKGTADMRRKAVSRGLWILSQDKLP